MVASLRCLVELAKANTMLLAGQRIMICGDQATNMVTTEAETDLSESTESNIRVGLGTYKPLTEEFLRLTKQLGVNDVLLTPHPHEEIESVMPLKEIWTIDELQKLHNSVEEFGLSLYAIEKMPVPLYEVLLGDYSKNIETIKKTIVNMGEVGISILGYSGHPPWGAVRTNKKCKVRGGAMASEYAKNDLQERKKDEVYKNASRERLWKKYEMFLEEVLPIAEQAGVSLAVHPSDPPVPEINGLPMLFHSRENFERALNIVPSENHGLKLCLGCWSEMGEDIPKILENFGAKNITYVHFRDVVGTVPNFHETFIDDEQSNFNETEIMKELHEMGFEGIVTPDHVPVMEGDTDWGFVSSYGQSFTTGYLRGLIEQIKHQNC